MSDDQQGRSREVSTIAFPYTDLDDALKVVRAMHSVGGGVPMERDQVAAAVNSAGGTLANRLSAAKQFGLIDNQQGKWTLTSLGYSVLDELTERAAKADAFLNVELYRRTFDEYRNKPLPGKLGLEHAFTTFGVAAKQKDKARQTFERSARSAGFFPNGSEDRLVRPIIMGSGDPVSTDAAELPNAVVSGAPFAPATVGPRLAGLNPFIEGLLSELPPAKSDWSMEDRAKWLQAAAQIFDLIYTGGQGRLKIMPDG